jgi:predicted DsbA family dithiol-disulfide isomerase
MRITYYLEVISSWCHWAEPAWTALQQRYHGRVTFDWKLALMDSSGLPKSKAQCDWFYRRSGTLMRSPVMLNSGWFDPSLREYLAPNLVVQAAKEMGASDDRVRLAVARAALLDGAPVGQWAIAAGIGAAAAGLDADELLRRAQSSEVLAVARATTAEFHTLQALQRPAFLLENAIGDRAMFSGLARVEPLAAALDAMLDDAAGYRCHAAHFGAPPSD